LVEQNIFKMLGGESRQQQAASAAATSNRQAPVSKSQQLANIIAIAAATAPQHVSNQQWALNRERQMRCSLQRTSSTLTSKLTCHCFCTENPVGPPSQALATS